MTVSNIELARSKFFKKLPQRIECTKCNKHRQKEKFGVRLMNKPQVIKGKQEPIFLRQSYCNDCRNE